MELQKLLNLIRSALDKQAGCNIELVDEDNWVYSIKDNGLDINIEENKLSIKIELIGEKTEKIEGRDWEIVN